MWYKRSHTLLPAIVPWDTASTGSNGRYVYGQTHLIPMIGFKFYGLQNI